MDQTKQRQLTELTEQNNTTCRERLCKNLCCFYTCFANFFECDRRFQEMEIVPYQVELISNQNVLDPMQKLQKLQPIQVKNVRTQDILVQESQSRRWGRLAQWTWWKRWLCCPYPEDDKLDFQTDYGLRQPSFSDEQKNFGQQNKVYSKNQRIGTTSDLNEKDDIIFMDDEIERGNSWNDDSMYAKNKTQASNKLNAQLINVKPREQFTGIGVRKRNKIYPSSISESNQNNNSNSQFLPQQTYENLKNNENRSSSITISSSQAQQALRQNSAPQAHNNLKSRNNFNQQDTFQSQSQSSSTKKLNEGYNITKNHEQISNQKLNIVNIPNYNSRGRYESQVIPQQAFNQDNGRKRKRKTNNAFTASVVPNQDFDVVEERPPEDLVKKKRRRRNQVKQDEKDKEQRAKRREQDQLQVVIFSQDDI